MTVPLLVKTVSSAMPHHHTPTVAGKATIFFFQFHSNLVCTIDDAPAQWSLLCGVWYTFNQFLEFHCSVCYNSRDTNAIYFRSNSNCLGIKCELIKLNNWKRADREPNARPFHFHNQLDGERDGGNALK